MGLRPAKCYRRLRRPYTRQSSKSSKAYVVGVPGSKIVSFVMGNRKEEDDFDKRITIVSENDVQIRHNAIEAARLAANKYMEKTLTIQNYFLRILKYPHHVLRENALATGAGADRFSSGMRASFGKPIGVAAQIREGQEVFEIKVNSENVKHAKEAARRAYMKLPTSCKVKVEDNK